MDAEIPIFFVCLAMSAFFSGSETAMLSANRLRLRHQAGEGSASARRVLELVQDPRKLLAGLLVGNNVFNVLATSAATSYCIRHFGVGKGVAIATVVATVTLVVFSEFLPKTIAAMHPVRWALGAVRLVRAMLVLLAPVVVPLDALTRPLGRLLARRAQGFGLSDVRTAVREGVRAGAVDETMAQVLRGGLSLEWKTVADILIPRVDVVAVHADTGFAECRELFRREGYSRLLVMEQTPDAELGYLSAKDLTLVSEAQRVRWKVRDSLRETLRVPASLPLPRLLARMRGSGVHFAVVKDEYGGTEGIVTLEDVLEELVGEIRDEHDELEIPPVIRVRPDAWMVRAEVSVRDLEERLEIDLPEAESRTVGGLVAERLGRLPVAGDRMEFGGFLFRVEQVDDNRVIRVRVSRPRLAPEDSSGGDA